MGVDSSRVRSLSESAAQFNGRIESLAAALLKARKDRRLADAGMAASLGLPMKKSAGVPVTYSVPVNRRRPRIEQIKVAGAFQPEPALASEDYEEILRIMKNPQFDMSYVTCAAFGSPRVLVSCCKTISRSAVTSEARIFESMQPPGRIGNQVKSTQNK